MECSVGACDAKQDTEAATINGGCGDVDLYSVMFHLFVERETNDLG